MSSTTDITTLLRNTAMVQLVGVEPSLIDLQLRWTLNDFLSRTGLLREGFTVTLVPAQANYTLTPVTTDGLLASLVSARIGDFTPLGASNLAGLPARTGTPDRAGLADALTLQVWPTPTEAATLTVLCTVTINPNSLVAPTVPFVCQPYFEALLSGVLGRIYALPDKPWTSERLAGYHKAEFERGKSRGRIAAETARAGAQGWQFQRFGR